MIELIVLFVILIIIFLSRAAPIANESSLNVSPYKVSISDVDIVPIKPRDTGNPLRVEPRVQRSPIGLEPRVQRSPIGLEPQVQPLVETISHSEIQRSPIGLEPPSLPCVDDHPIVADHKSDLPQEPSKKSTPRMSEADKKDQVKSSRHRISFAPRILVRTFNINSGEILNQYTRNL